MLHIYNSSRVTGGIIHILSKDSTARRSCVLPEYKADDVIGDIQERIIILSILQAGYSGVSKL